MNQNEIIQQLEALPGVIKCRLGGNVATALFANYKCKVIFGGGREVGEFGYGSFALANNAEYLSDTPVEDYIIKVGNYCEAFGGKILLGGEHNNKIPINTAFSAFPNFQMLAKKIELPLNKFCSRGPVHIGNNVTIANNSTIISGVKIGDGAIIGAGAVVTKDVPDFAIVAGNPAKILRYRFDSRTQEALKKIRWWDLKQEALLDLFAKIQKIPDSSVIDELLNIPLEKYRPEDNKYLVFGHAQTGRGSAFSFLGVEINGEKKFPKDLPDIFKYFVMQPSLQNTPDTNYYLVDDIFSVCGL